MDTSAERIFSLIQLALAFAGLAAGLWWSIHNLNQKTRRMHEQFIRDDTGFGKDEKKEVS
jgi:hypothetical protein